MSVAQHGPLPPSNFAVGRSGMTITTIVLHTTTCWIGAADARFHDPASQVSAHFGVRVDGTLWQWVNVWDTAYHAGYLPVNLRSVGIEDEDEGNYNAPRPDVLYARVSALVAQTCAENPVPCARGTAPGPGVYDHRDVIKIAMAETGRTAADLSAAGLATITACPDGLDTDRIIWQAQSLINAGKINALLATIPAS